MLSFLFVGSVFYEEGVTQEGIDNATDALSYDNLNISIANEANNKNNSVFDRIIYKSVDLMMFTTTTVAQGGMNYGYEHPEYNFEFVFRLFVIGLWIWIINVLFRPAIFIGYAVKQIVILIKRKLQEINEIHLER